MTTQEHAAVLSRLECLSDNCRESAAMCSVDTAEGQCWVRLAVELESIAQAIAALEAQGEAVAGRWVHPDGDSGEWYGIDFLTPEYRAKLEADGATFEYAYAALPAARGIPAGFVLVPVPATPEMLTAAQAAYGHDAWFAPGRIYAAMIAAAPPVAAAPPAVEDV